MIQHSSIFLKQIKQDNLLVLAVLVVVVVVVVMVVVVAMKMTMIILSPLTLTPCGIRKTWFVLRSVYFEI